MSKQVFGVNAADDTTAVATMYLFPSGEPGYVLSVQGKNGEGYPNKAVKLLFTHRYLKNKVAATVRISQFKAKNLKFLIIFRFKLMKMGEFTSEGFQMSNLSTPSVTSQLSRVQMNVSSNSVVDY